MDEICGPLFEWYDKHKRNLPWRDTRVPYYIWILTTLFYLIAP